MAMYLAFGFMGLGGGEILIILVIALLIFGRRLPEVGKSLGKGIVEFKKGLKGIEDDLDQADQDIDTPKSDDNAYARQIESDAGYDEVNYDNEHDFDEMPIEEDATAEEKPKSEEKK